MAFSISTIKAIPPTERYNTMIYKFESTLGPSTSTFESGLFIQSFLHTVGDLPLTAYSFHSTSEGELRKQLFQYIVETRDETYGSLDDTLSILTVEDIEGYVKLLSRHRMECLSKLVEERGTGFGLSNYAFRYKTRFPAIPMTHSSITQLDVCRMILSNGFKDSTRDEFDVVEWKCQYISK